MSGNAMTERRAAYLEAVLAEAAVLAPEALGEEFLGLYLTGSAAAGRLHPAVQDVDLLFLVERPLGVAPLLRLRSALRTIETWFDSAETRVAWQIVSGPWKPAPADGKWTIALHGNIFTRRQLHKLATHQPNIAATMFAAGRVLAGAHPRDLVEPGVVTPACQRENVFGLRWLRELLFSVATCTIEAPRLAPVLADVLQYATLTGARNYALLRDALPPEALSVVDRVRRLKEAGATTVPRDLLAASGRALAAMDAGLIGGPNG